MRILKDRRLGWAGLRSPTKLDAASTPTEPLLGRVSASLCVAFAFLCFALPSFASLFA